MKNVGKIHIYALCIFAGFWDTFLGSTFNVVLPLISLDIQMSPSEYGWVMLAQNVVMAVLFLPVGRLSDRCDKRRVLLFGVALYLVSALWCGFANSPEQLIFANILNSFGSAILYVNAMAIGVMYAPEGSKGLIVGLISAGIYTGRVAGPLLGGVISDHFGWRILYIASAVFCLLLLYAVFTLKNREEFSHGFKRIRGKFDWLGLGLLSAAIYCFIYGVTMLPELAYSEVFVILGLLCAIAFVLWEKRAKDPLLDLSLFKNNRTLTFSLFCVMLLYMSSYSVSGLISMYLQYARGLSAEVVGALISTTPLIQVFLSPVSGRLADKYQVRTVATLGAILVFAALLMLLWGGHAASPLWFAIALGMIGVGLAFANPPNTSAAMSAVSSDKYSVASSLVGQFRNLGQSMSLGVMNLFMIANIGRVNISTAAPAGFEATYSLTLLVFTIVIILAVLLSWFRKV